jgi:hypothetical protein
LDRTIISSTTSKKYIFMNRFTKREIWEEEIYHQLKIGSVCPLGIILVTIDLVVAKTNCPQMKICEDRRMCVMNIWVQKIGWIKCKGSLVPILKVTFNYKCWIYFKWRHFGWRLLFIDVKSGMHRGEWLLGLTLRNNLMIAIPHGFWSSMAHYYSTAYSVIL